MTWPRLLVLSLACLAGACSSSRSAERPAPERRAAEFFPLKPGDVWVYERVSGPRKDTEKHIVTQQHDERTYTLTVQLGGGQSAGQPPRTGQARMEVRPRGIFDGTRYILQEPLEPGRKWKVILDVRHSEQFEILTINGTADVPAGRFNNCVVVRSTAHEPGDVTMTTDTTYCRGVGIVESMESVAKPGRPTLMLGHLRLQHYESGGQRIFPKRLGE